MALWGGRFEGESDPLFKQFNDSLPFDYLLADDDITGSIAWSRALQQAGVLTDDESQRIAKALGEIRESAQTDPQAIANAGDEDIHAWVERQLIDKVGDLGKKLHTGRSRNDQVATDFRLWARRETTERIREIRDAQTALVRLAERELGSILPGYTHLQRAQPVLFSHWCLAYFEMLQRDATRFEDAQHRLNVCPLGSAALAGTSYDIDRDALASSLHFFAPTRNSLDAVSDRDFGFELLAAGTLCAIHLSRIAEDLIFYASGEADFIALDDTMTSGSSLMPQKKNPDALELIRGKTGRILGNLTGFAATLKGLPLAYNKDMQEDKEPLFEAMHHLSLSLQALPRVLKGLSVKRANTRLAAEGGYSNATDLADYLVARDIPFREAHDIVGAIVRHAINAGKPLDQLPVHELKSFSDVIDDDVHACLPLEAGLKKRNVLGGTAPNRVAQALKTANQLIDRERKEAGEDVIEIRPARIDDVDDIIRLIDFWTEKGETLPRKADEVIEAIRDFGIAESSGRICGCGSLLTYTPQLAEIRSLVVDPEFHGGGIGSKLVRHFQFTAAELHVPKVFVLTRAPEFFGRLGFERVTMDTLPEKVWKDCRLCPKQHCCDEIAMVYQVNGR